MRAHLRPIIPAAAAAALRGAPPAASFTSAAALAAAAKKATPVKKKKVAIKKKSGPSGPRGDGGRRKGGTDAGASSMRASEWSSSKPDMALLPDFNAGSASALVGRVAAFSGATMAALKAFGLPKQLGLALARQPRPRTLIRPQSATLFSELDAAASNGSQSPTSVLYGPTGSGASMLLVHSVAYAHSQGWVVLYLPYLIGFVNSTSPYAYDPTQRTYLQPAAAQQVLQSLLAVNETHLEGMAVDEAALTAAQQALSSASLPADILVQAQKDVRTLAKAGVADSVAPPLRQVILEIVFQSVVSQVQVPVLVAMDDFQALYAASRYRDPDYRSLQSYQLAIPRLLLQLVRRWKVKRGTIIGALSHEHAPLSFPSVAQELYTVLGLAGTSIAGNPFAALQSDHVKHVRQSDLRLRNVLSRELQPHADSTPGLHLDEASAIFSCLKKERAIFTPANDELFLSKLIESGGNLGAFERGLQRTLV